MKGGAFRPRFWGLSLLVFLAASGPAAGADALLEQGLAAFKAQNYGQAVKLLGDYLQRQPQDLTARSHRAQAFQRLERPREALAEVEAGLQVQPGAAELLLLKGSLLGELGERSQAVAIFNQVLHQDPDNVTALKERGVNLANDGKLDEALRDLNRAAQLAPTDPWVFNHRGMVHFCRQDYQAAVADFSQAIKLRPDLPHAYFFRANLYRYHLNQPDQARSDFAQGCKLGHPLCCDELEKMGPPKAADGKKGLAH